MKSPFRYFNSSPQEIRLAVMMYIRYPVSFRQLEDLLFERGIDLCYETMRFWWNRFGPMFAAEIRKRRVHHRLYSNWRWDMDKVFVQIIVRKYGEIPDRCSDPVVSRACITVRRLGAGP